ncbi:TetR/AcrR family transcriptional regulator [Gordonia sp. DT101]|uniref:TetR/AcrR family transcriptional regulator n=1 Tax=Gordonia sp. DT101 TaxID=3416545 RepID=UPI003CF175BE
MPRLTQETAQSRRDEIVAAALRVMATRGVARTSIADISAESGLSTGSIYSHFGGKAQIAADVAASVIGPRAQALVDSRFETPEPQTPREILGVFLGALDDDQVPHRVVLQMWAEAAVDVEIGNVVEQAIGQIRDAYKGAVARWVAAQGGRVAEVDAITRGMVAVSQGYIVHRALFGPLSLNEYLAGVDAALGRPHTECPDA